MINIRTKPENKDLVKTTPCFRLNKSIKSNFSIRTYKAGPLHSKGTFLRMNRDNETYPRIIQTKILLFNLKINKNKLKILI